MNKRWSEMDIELLIKVYPYGEWEEILKIFYPRTKSQIIDKASDLKIKRENYHYNQYEIELLKKHYGILSIKEIRGMMPYRSEYSIMVKANKLGLVSREKWNEDDVKLLIKEYPYKTNEEIKSILNNRTITAIQSMADILGLRKSYSKKEFSEDYLIDKLKELSEKLGRTPFYFDLIGNEEYPSLGTYYRYFGNYRNACKIADLEINASLFGEHFNVYKANNGYLCFSKSELVITNYLIINNINFKKEVYYRDIINDDRCGMKRCDWLLDNDMVVEYFGLPRKEKYKIKMEEKRNICMDNNIKLIEIFEEDILRLDEIFVK